MEYQREGEVEARAAAEIKAAKKERDP